MKQTVLLLMFFWILYTVRAQNTDLPMPDANLQTLPTGSYVIAMDNSLQVNSSGDFNLKAYGLLVHLLNNTVHLKWSIKAGKLKDGIDFTATAEQIKPTYAAAASRSFKAGPFVISAEDTSGVAALIDAFYTANSLTGLNRPQVYRLTANTPNVDIRYDLWGFRPKAAVLTDGGNQSLHLAYMTNCSIPSTNYATSAGTDLLTNCFTFASEPHNNNTGTAVNNAISAIRDFVTKGGNFLAQCEAVTNYENNSLGRFQTTSGITIANTGISTTLSYDNPDLSFSQIEGAYNASQGGSLKNWKIVGSTANSAHNHAAGTGTNSSVIGASVSKHYNGKGGLVFYIGNHSFATTTLAGINGIRMYMNAFLTPSNTNCPSLVFSALPVRLIHFGVRMVNRLPQLQWSVEGNEELRNITIEISSNGSDFSALMNISPTGRSGHESYQYSSNAVTPGAFYRLKLEDRQGKVFYSLIVSSRDEANNEGLSVLNASGNPQVIAYASGKATVVQLYLFHSSGALVYQNRIKCQKGNTLLAIPHNQIQQPGIYFLEAIDKEGKRSTAKLLRMP